ncbi:MAG: hypothetical protein ACRDHU_09170 [Actinomycetota bacterium]
MVAYVSTVRSAQDRISTDLGGSDLGGEMPESTAGREGSVGPAQIETATGEMATIRVLVTFPQEERGDVPYQSPPPSVLEELRNQRKQLHQQIEEEIRDLLGPDAEVDELVILSGSLEILALVSTVATVVTNFNSLVDNLGKATERIRRAVRFVLRRLPAMRNMEYQVHGEWTPGPAMRGLQQRLAPQPAPVPQPSPTSAPVAAASQASVVSWHIGAFIGAYGLLLAILVMVAILLARA